MSERLRHLQRQQSLLREHLAWIDAEIARENTAAPPPGATTIIPTVLPPADSAAAPAPSPTPTPTPTPAPAPATDADELLKRYADEERENPGAIRSGCFIVFGASLLLLIATVATVWLVYYR